MGGGDGVGDAEGVGDGAAVAGFLLPPHASAARQPAATTNAAARRWRTRDRGDRAGR
jgi:hypothetical protein